MTNRSKSLRRCLVSRLMQLCLAMVYLGATVCFSGTVHAQTTAERGDKPSNRPNIVLIMADDLGIPI